MLLTATPTSGSGGATVSVDYSAFKDAYGGGWSGSLHLVKLPACALTTPDVAACRVQTPVSSTDDPATTQVSGQVAFAAADPVKTAASSGPAVVQSAAVESTGAATGQMMVLWFMGD